MNINIALKNAEHTFENAHTLVAENGNLSQVSHTKKSKITACVNRSVINKAKSKAQFQDFTHRFENVCLTPKELLREIAVEGHAFCSANLNEGEYGYCHRKEDNFVSSWILAIDIDNVVRVKENDKKIIRKKTIEEGYYSFNDAVIDPFVLENASSVYTTPTHTTNHHRFRILFVLENEINDVNIYKKAIKSLNKFFDDDPATVSACQGFFGSKNSTYKYFGNRFSDNEFNRLLELQEEKETNLELKDLESEGFEAKEFKKEDIDEIVKYIFLNGKIDNNHWWKVPVILYNYFGLTESEIVNLISKYTEVGDTREKVRYAKKYSELLKIGTLIWLAKKNGYKIPNRLRGKNYKPTFWKLIPIKDSNDNLIDFKYITRDNDFEEFLNLNGFFNYFNNGKSNPVKIVNKVVNDSYEAKIRNFTLNYLKSNIDFDGNEMQKDAVLNGFSRDATRVVSNSTKNLPILNKSDDDIFKRDQEYISFIYYQNGFNEITDSSIIFRKYDELDAYVHNESLTKRDYCLSDNQTSIVEKFLRFLSTDRLEDGQTKFDKNKFKSLSSILGYLTSTFKKKEFAKAIVLTDSDLTSSDNNEGGTGKSLFANIIRYVRNLTVIDGRNFNYESEFKFNQINHNTEVCLINDCSNDFKFDNFYNVITDDLSIRQLHKGTFNIPFERSPKFILTTNSVISGNGNSDRRRKLEIEVSNYFNQNCTPADELGRLFDSWDELEWNRFDDFIAKCVQLYLQKGLIESVPKNIDLKRFYNSTCDGFVNYARNYLMHDKLYWFDSIKEDYEKVSGEIISTHKFSKYLKEWCTYTSYNMNIEYLKNENNRRVIVFSLDKNKNMNYWKTSNEFQELKLKTSTFPSKL